MCVKRVTWPVTHKIRIVVTFSNCVRVNYAPTKEEGLACQHNKKSRLPWQRHYTTTRQETILPLGWDNDHWFQQTYLPPYLPWFKRLEFHGFQERVSVVAEISLNYTSRSKPRLLLLPSEKKLVVGSHSFSFSPKFQWENDEWLRDALNWNNAHSSFCSSFFKVLLLLFGPRLFAIA